MKKVRIVLHYPEVITYYLDGSKWRLCRIKEEDILRINDVSAVEIYINGLKNTLRLLQFDVVEVSVIYFDRPDIAVAVSEKLVHDACAAISLIAGKDAFSAGVVNFLKTNARTSGVFEICGVRYAAETYSSSSLNIRRLDDVRAPDSVIDINGCFRSVAETEPVEHNRSVVLAKEESKEHDIIFGVVSKWVNTKDNHLDMLYTLMNEPREHSQFELVITLCKAMTLAQIPESDWKAYRNGRRIADDFTKKIGDSEFYKLLQSMMRDISKTDQKLKDFGVRERRNYLLTYLAVSDMLSDTEKVKKLFDLAMANNLPAVWRKWTDGNKKA